MQSKTELNAKIPTFRLPLRRLLILDNEEGASEEEASAHDAHERGDVQRLLQRHKLDGRAARVALIVLCNGIGYLADI